MSQSRIWEESGKEYRLHFFNKKAISLWGSLPVQAVNSQPCEVIKPKGEDYLKEMFRVSQKTRAFLERSHGCLGGGQKGS